MALSPYEEYLYDLADDRDHPTVDRQLDLERQADGLLGTCRHFDWGSCWTEGQAEIIARIVENERRGRPWWHGVGTRGQHIVYRFAVAPANPEDHETTIYVGMTSNLPARLRAHSRKWWWPMVSPDRSEFQPVPTRKFAAELEAVTIHNEQPAMNRAGRVLVPRFVEVPR